MLNIKKLQQKSQNFIIQSDKLFKKEKANYQNRYYINLYKS